MSAPEPLGAMVDRMQLELREAERQHRADLFLIRDWAEGHCLIKTDTGSLEYPQPRDPHMLKVIAVVEECERRRGFNKGKAEMPPTPTGPALPPAAVRVTTSPQRGEKAACENCLFYRRRQSAAEEVPHDGYCHRFPPSRAEFVDRGFEPYINSASFVRIASSDWCGEHKPR